VNNAHLPSYPLSYLLDGHSNRKFKYKAVLNDANTSILTAGVAVSHQGRANFTRVADNATNMLVLSDIRG
jgi:hypothetical protein